MDDKGPTDRTEAEGSTMEESLSLPSRLRGLMESGDAHGNFGFCGIMKNILVKKNARNRH